MKRKLLFAFLPFVVLGVKAQTLGDTFTNNGHKYRVTGSNLISNGTFDSSFTGWTQANDFTTEITSANFEIKTSGGQEGNNYLLGKVNNGATGAGSLGTAWTITKNKTYVFSYWIKGEKDGTDTGYIISSLTNTKSTETYKLGTPLVTKGSWKQFQVVFFNRDYDFLQIDFRWLNGQWGFDNFVLAEVDEVVNDDVPEPSLTHFQNFGGSAVSSYYYKQDGSYPVNNADFTIEMTGTSGTQILLKGVGIAYTPSATGTIRFARKDNVVYVYENGSYVGTIGQYTTFDEVELLNDYNFATVGDKIENNKFKLSSAWSMSNTSAYGGTGIRLSDNTPGVNNGTVLIWRGTGNNNYFSQQITSTIEASTDYKIRVYQFTGSNAGADFHIGLGTSAGDYSLASVDERLGYKWNTTYVNGVHTLYITTPAVVGSDVYFTFKNTDPSTTDKSDQNDALTQIEWVSLVKCDGTITGATDVKVLEGAAYAPASVADAKAVLLSEIAAATDIDKTTNVGAAAFQIPASAVTALNNAIDEAQGVYDSGSATVTEVETATSGLQAAELAYANAALNAPAADVRYTLTLTDADFKHKNKAVEFVKGGQTEAQGVYAIQYNNSYNANKFVQHFYFKATGETNLYNIWFVDDDGENRYICDGTVTGAGTGAFGIRTTTDASKALAIKVIAGEAEGVTHLWNTKADQYIGSNGDQGMYTDSKYTHFVIAEATQASVAVNVAADAYATRIFPFKPSAIDGITYYSCKAVADDALTLTEVATEDLAANTPYILHADKAVSTTLEGWGTAKQDTYADGLLTGIYAATTIAAGANNYVLQTQGEHQAFYLVTEEFTNTTPYRAYLTYAASSAAKVLRFVDHANAIEGVESHASFAKNAGIYNLSGQRMQNLQKGLNIVNGKKVLVK